MNLKLPWSAKASQKAMNSIFILSGVITLVILLVILSYILIKGLPVINFDFIFSNPIDSGEKGGIFPMIVSSIYMTFVAVVIATPIGIGSAIYMSEYAKNQKVINAVRFGSEILASVPSIIFGLFGLAFFVIFLNLGWSILSGALVLALMSIPTIYQVAESTLSSIPNSCKEGAYGLGATKWQVICEIIIPMALPGIITGVILAITRAISEAAAVMYAVGASLSVPITLFDPGRPLPLHLYMLATEGISLSNAYGTAAVLVIIVLGLTILTNYIVERYQKRISGEI